MTHEKPASTTSGLVNVSRSQQERDSPAVLEKHYTLVFIFDRKKEAQEEGDHPSPAGSSLPTSDSLLLGMKKRGFGIGKWNGFGGKVEHGESPLACAYREVEEECGLIAVNLQARGQLLFTFETIPIRMAVHVFSSAQYKGVPTETDEMKPQWYRFEDIPYDRMWADDQHWLPYVIAGKNVDGIFRFQDETVILEYKLRVLDSQGRLIETKES